MTIVQIVSNWFEEHSQSLKNDGLIIESGGTDETIGKYFDVLDSKLIGRLTTWTDGQAEISIFNIQSETSVYSKYYEKVRLEDLSVLLDDFLIHFR